MTSGILMTSTQCIKCNERGNFCWPHFINVMICFHCKKWKDWYCKKHENKCWTCENGTYHVEKRRFSCTICKLQVYIDACCSHRAITVIKNQREPRILDKCSMCQWILCSTDRRDCLGCQSAYCHDHYGTSFQYCFNCVFTIKSRLIFVGLKTNVNIIINFLLF